MSSPSKNDNDKKGSKRSWFLRWLPDKSQFSHLPKLLSRGERMAIFFFSILALAGVIILPFTTFYHFTKAAPDFGGTYTEGIVGTPKYINPLLAQANDSDRDMSELVYAGLMKYDENGRLINDLAQSYSISADGLSYTFKIKPNIVWQDGKPITADDVLFTILAIQNSDYSSPQRINWQGVDISKIDDLTVIFRLKNKYAQFLGNITLGILPKHVWENIKPGAFGLSEFNSKPIGSGPYQIDRIARDSAGNIRQLELNSFEKYNEGKPYISKLVFKFYDSEQDMITAFNNNEIDALSYISPQNLSSVRFSGTLKINNLQLPRYFGIFLNQNQSKILSEKEVRTAINYSTDKNKIISDILSGNGTVVDSPMLPGILPLEINFEPATFDIAKANDILDKAGWKKNESGFRVKKTTEKKGKETITTETPLEITITTSNWPELISVSEKIKDQWQEAGVKVNTIILSLPELQQTIKDRDYEALLFGEVLGLDPDPFSFWHSSQKKDPGLNLALYDNKDADKILEDTRQTLDFESRMNKYAEFQKILLNDVPSIFLYSPNYLYAQSSKVHDNNNKIISIPSNRLNGINKWYIDTKRVLK